MTTVVTQHPQQTVVVQAKSLRKVGSALVVLAVSLILIYLYINWLEPNYSYFGFTLIDGDRPVLWLAVFLLQMSAWVLPVVMRRLSDYFLWMIFYFVYLPSMLFVPLQGSSGDQGLWLVVSLAISFTVMTAIARIKIEVPLVRCSRNAFMGAFFALYFALNLYVLSVYGASLSLVQFPDVYEQRALSEEVAAGSLVGYAAGFLSGAFNPFLMAVGLTERRKLWLVAGMAGQVLMYSTAALKFVLLSAMLAPLLFFFHVKRKSVTSTRLGLLVIASCLVPFAFIPVLGDAVDGILWQVLSLILMRSYGMGGALTGVYGEYFSTHPYTYYSHVNVVGLFIPYPYKLSVGEEVGFDLMGRWLNANANFWATDGIAAAGYAGVVLIGVIVGAFLVFCNGTMKSEIRRLAFISFIPFIMSVSNSSFFTSLFTGGGGVLLVLLYFWQGSKLQRQAR